MAESNRDNEFIERVSRELSRPLDSLRRHVASVKTACSATMHPQECKVIDRLDDQIDDIQAKLDDLLTLSELDDRYCQSSRRATNLCAVMQQIQPMLVRQSIDRDVTLEFHGFDAVPATFCDDQQIGRILSRLGTRAIRSCESHGLVRFWARHDPESQSVRIGITDNGFGLNEERRSRLEEHFIRPDSEAVLTDPSVPLELSIAARLCRLNLSQLRVESDRDLGTIFWFDLPTAESTEIFARWLRLRDQPRGPIHLIRMQLNRELSGTQHRDAEMLLAALTQNDELLLGKTATCWLLASETHAGEAAHRAEAIVSELSTLAEVGATGPDVSFHVSVEKRWDRTASDQQIIDDFDRITWHQHNLSDDRPIPSAADRPCTR